MIRIAAFMAFVLVLTGAAQASGLSCLDRRPGVSFSFGIAIGDDFTESEKNDFNVMMLRRMGVDASSAEMWDGCIRAYVRKPGGGEEMQFFHPDTYERVYL